MTKKDFILIANAIATTRAAYRPAWNPNLFRALDDTAIVLAHDIAQTNPMFNRKTFLKACGVSDSLIEATEEVTA